MGMNDDVEAFFDYDTEKSPVGGENFPEAILMSIKRQKGTFQSENFSLSTRQARVRRSGKVSACC
jgi:hypothetical protein